MHTVNGELFSEQNMFQMWWGWFELTMRCFSFRPRSPRAPEPLVTTQYHTVRGVQKLRQEIGSKFPFSEYLSAPGNAFLQLSLHLTLQAELPAMSDHHLKP